MEIAVVGNDDFVTGFQLAGVKYVFETNGNIDEQVEKALQNEEIGILVLEEEGFEKLSFQTKKQLEKTILPVVVTLSKKEKETNLREMIKRSIGVDLWK